ncbi:hypothetical protein N7495_008214 [Penicillium taxi]|uniref:uncharacterized protein n=1 Tax=Penicillium taxi TaxID=168475 RepID=UPI002545A2EE|nr:uncharacterized protein N7495_008214 [Penicillium taxi]KAJ5888173.1 hypothetical protein N7495_008214 [Penicillium taxi]
MTCPIYAWAWSSMTFSCEEKFTTSYTAIFTRTSVFGTNPSTTTTTVAFTPNFDAINAFQIEYVPVKTSKGFRRKSHGYALKTANLEHGHLQITMTNTSISTTTEATATTTMTTATTTTTSLSLTTTATSASNKSGSTLSGGAIAGIVIGVVAFIAIIALVWNRIKLMAWVHQKTTPRSDRMERIETNNLDFSPSWYPNGRSDTTYKSEMLVEPPELESRRALIELPERGLSELN